MAASQPAGQLGHRGRIDVVAGVALAVGDVDPGAGQPLVRRAREVDGDHRVAAAVGDVDRQPGAIEVGLPAVDGRDEPAQRDDPGRRWATIAEPERVRHDRALGEAADDGALPRHAGGLVDALQEAVEQRVGLRERLRVGEAHARHDVPVAAARRQEQRPAGRHADEPALGIEHVEERGEVVLVGAAAVQEHERALGLARGRAHALDELARRGGRHRPHRHARVAQRGQAPARAARGGARTGAVAAAPRRASRRARRRRSRCRAWPVRTARPTARGSRPSGSTGGR